MAKMIKHKDSFVSSTVFSTMLKRVIKVDAISKEMSLVIMEDQTRAPIEVKAPFSTEKIVEAVENNEVEGEIAAHLFSYYIGEI